MVRTDISQELPNPSWLEALHASIAAEVESGSGSTVGDAVTELAGDSDADRNVELGDVRNCLRLLDQLRREQHTTTERPRRIGRFQIVREVGRGGFGVVLAAIDPQVGRQVALKIPRPEILVSPSTRTRFLREAQAAGGLSHPNLIAIHEVGEDGPICYIISELCTGTNLAQWLAAREQPIADREAAEILVPLARAVAHAHRRGVLHRDIKPSNVLLEPSELGQAGTATVEALCFRPMLTDFGLARISELMDEHTRTGTLLGTPAYMAPEQAEGRISTLGPATDIYALGVLLYELLSGRPPLRGETDLQTLQLVAQGEVPALSSWRPHVSRDLAAIVHKCLETTPVRRYATADDLADDLQRFLSNRPTQARPAGIIVRATKWCRRRPLVAALGAVILLSIVVSGNFGWRYLEQRRIAADSQYHRRQEIAERLYVASMNAGADLLAINRRSQVRDQLSAWMPESGEPDRRSFAWHYLNRQLDDAPLSLKGHTRDIYRVAYSPDGKLLATSGADGTARIWDAESGACQHVLRGHTDEVNCVAFHPHGRQVATAGDDQLVIVWDVDTGQQIRKIKSSKKKLGVAFHPDGKRLAICGSAYIELFELGIEERTHRLGGHLDLIGAIEFSHSGKWLASAAEDGTVRVWDVDALEVQAVFKTTYPANTVAFSSDEKWLVASNRTGRRVSRFDLSTMTEAGPIYQSFDWIHSVAFHPSNEVIAVTAKDGAVDLVEIESSKVVRRIRGHDVRVWSASFSPDGKHLATAGADGTVKIWNLDNGSYLRYRGPQGPWSQLLLSAAGRLGHAQRPNGELTAFDVDHREIRWQTLGDFEVVGDFNGDRRLDSALFQNGVWQLDYAGEPVDSSAEPKTFHFGARGDWPLVGDWDGDGRDNLGCYSPSDSTIRLDFDGHGGCPEKIIPLYLHHGISAVPISARWPNDARDCPGVAVYHGGEVRTWEVSFHRDDEWREMKVAADNTGDTWLPLFGRWHTGLASHQFGFMNADQLWNIPLPDGNWVLDAEVPRYRRLQNPPRARFQPPEELPMLPGALFAANEMVRRIPRSCAVSPDAQQIATIFAYDSRVRINDPQSGLRIATLEAAAAIPSAVAFDPQGTTIYVGTTEGRVLQYDSKTFRRRQTSSSGGASISNFYFSGNGRVFASIDSDGAIAVRYATGEPISTLPRDRLDLVSCLALSHDGGLCAVCSPLRPVSIYRVDTGERLTSLASDAINSSAAAFSPDGRTLATGGDGSQIILWDTATWEQLFSLPTGEVTFSQLAFSDDGTVLTGIGMAANGEIRIPQWHAEPH